MSTPASSSTALDRKESTRATTRNSQRKKRVKVNDTAGDLELQTKSAIRQRKTGRLSQFMSMPMDILMEIFGHLLPLDLLHLARTTKAFRQVLMHRSSVFVWKAAILNVPGFPDCPPELSEPQWTNLAFDAHCNLCLRPNIRTVDWRLRVRLCIKCTKQHITNWSNLSLYQEHGHLRGAVATRYGKRGQLQCLRDEYDRVRTQCRAIEDLNARATFLAERKQLVKRINEHDRLCVAWASSQAMVRSDELDRLKSSRHQAILDRLVALGWGDEIKQIPRRHDLKNHQLVKVLQLLTDRIWANISGTIIQYMEKMKANRLVRELGQLHTQRKLDAIKLLQQYKAERAPLIQVMPAAFDFYAFGPIKEIVEQPSDINVDSESFSHLMPELDGLVEEWRRTIFAKFIQEVKVGIVDRSVLLDDHPLGLDNASDESILQRIQLACTVFTCSLCNLGIYDDVYTSVFGDTSSRPTRALWFPRVLGHRCLMKPPGSPSDIESTDGTMRLKKLPRFRREWSCRWVTVDQVACKAAVAIVETCNMDPIMATVDEMDQLDARLECLHCYRPELDDSHFVFDWRSAVRHECESHPSTLDDWRMLTANEADVARAEEDRWEAGMSNAVMLARQKVWLCLHCLDLPSEESWKTLEDVRNHVKCLHGVEDSRVDRDYVKDFAAPELYPTFTLSAAIKVKFPA